MSVSGEGRLAQMFAALVAPTRSLNVPWHRSPSLLSNLAVQTRDCKSEFTIDWPTLAVAFAATIVLSAAAALMLATARRLGDSHEWDQAIEAVVVAWRNGQPLYPAATLGWVYALPYGPAHFLYLDGLDRLGVAFGVSLGDLNLGLAALAPVAVFVALTWRHADATFELRIAAAALAMFLGFFATGFHVGLQSTPVLWLLLAIAMAVRIEHDGSWIGPAIVVGAIAGGLAATKISALFYLVPILVSGLHRIGAARRWLGPISTGILASAIVVALAFFPDGVSLPDYIATLVAFDRPIDERTFRRSILYTVPIAIVAATATLDKSSRPMAVATLAILPPVVWVASLHGSGAWHLAPLAPIVASLSISAHAAVARRVPQAWGMAQIVGAPAIASFALTGLWFYDARSQAELTTQGSRMWRGPEAVAARAALAEVLDRHAGANVVLMPGRLGVNESPESEASGIALRTMAAQPARRGSALYFTLLSWSDHAGGTRLASFIERVIATCAADIVVTPIGSRVLRRDTREAVAKHYARIPGAEPFEVWACRRDVSDRQPQ